MSERKEQPERSFFGEIKDIVTGVVRHFDCMYGRYFWEKPYCSNIWATLQEDGSGPYETFEDELKKWVRVSSQDCLNCKLASFPRPKR